MPKVTTKFSLTEEKKHSVRYDAEATAVAAPGPIASTSIYVSKRFLSRKPYPLTITITVEAGEL